MTSEGGHSRDSLIKGIAWLAGLIILMGMIGIGVKSWKDHPANRFAPHAFISVDEFLKLKKQKQIREVWFDRNELFARMEVAYVVGGEAYPFVNSIVPSSYLNPAGIEELRSGLDPSRFTILRPYR